MNKKKLIAILTLMSFMFTLVPMAVMAEATNETTEVATFDELKSAVTTGGAIQLKGTIKLTETLTIDKDVTINNGTITYGEGFSGTMFNIVLDGTSTFGSLTLNNVTIDGGVKWTFDENNKPDIDAESSSGAKLSAPLINVSGRVVQSEDTVLAAALNLNNGTIQNVYDNMDGGNSKHPIIYATGGTVNMEGTCVTKNIGEIIRGVEYSTVSAKNIDVTNNFLSSHNGGFVYLYDFSTFTLYSGNIYKNYHVGRSGVIIASCRDSSAIMEGGSIYENIALSTGSNTIGSMIYMERGGDFTMNGGEIINNTGCRASAIADRWTDAGDNEGKTLSILTLNAGTISGNKTVLDVFLNATVFIRNLNTTIGSGMVIDGDVVLDEKTYNNQDPSNTTGIYDKLDGYAGSFTNNGTINGDVFLRNTNASDLWHDKDGANGGKFPGNGTLNGVIRDNIADELYTKSGTLIDGSDGSDDAGNPLNITKNEDGTWTIPDGSTIKTSDGTTFTTDETVTTDKDGNIVIPAGSSIETKDNNGNTDMKVTGPATLGADGDIVLNDGSSITRGNGEPISVPNGVTVTIPAEKLSDVDTEDGSIVLPVGSVVENENAQIEVDEAGTVIITSDGIKVAEDKDVIVNVNGHDVSVTGPAVIANNGDIIVGEGGNTEVGDATVKGEATAKPDGNVEIAAGKEVVVVTPSGEITVTGPATVDDEGNVKLGIGGSAVVNGTKVSGEATIKPDGTIEVADGKEATVTTQDGMVIIVTGSVTIDEDGDVTLGVNGSAVVNGTEVSGEATIKPDGTVKVADGKEATVTTQDGMAITITGSVTIDEDGDVTLGVNGSAVVNGTEVSGEATIKPDGTIEVADGKEATILVGGKEVTVTGPATVDAEGNVTIDAGGRAVVDGATVTGPAYIETNEKGELEVTIEGDGTITTEDGTVVKAPAGSSITVPADKLSEVTTDSKGNIVLPSSSVVTKGDTVTKLPYGGSLAEDGTVTVNPAPSTGGGFSGVYNYQVAVVQPSNGTITLSESNAVKGETVIVTATPDNGYGTSAVIVTDGGNETITVTDLQNGTYSFVMPEGKVSVTAVFKDAIVLKIGDNNMNVFGKTVVNDVAPQIKDDYTMLPIRPVVEALDGDVAWDPDTQKITVKLNGKTVVMYVGESVGYIDGVATEMDVPSYIHNSRAFYQLRFVAAATDTDIFWNKDLRLVTLIPE